MGPPKKGEKEKNQNIQVVVRCRPLNSSEKKQGSYSVVECSPELNEVNIKERLIPGAPMKTFKFDKVFNHAAKQIELYKSVMVPLLDEVLQGYNCTVFAYGQTGTGKTFTMEGECSNDPNISWEEDPLTGIIPRAMNQLFSRLQRQQCEFSVRVSFLEIYNEELIDLLGAESVENPRLRIYEDSTRKVKDRKMGSCVIQGLEEVLVADKHEVHHILELGAARRQTAATLMNAHSSRSHSLFMVTIHIKENSVDGDELVKTGKLNLVDLAGSECIGRSGAVDKRAREAGQINQSLLTLGRVISALVEHTPHVPYRESKLTRLLQDSLGGRTKTSIVATISPSASCLEETLSTLDYAHRAKNIMNRPEVNQKLTKKALIKEYTDELERLRKDLQAARDKNGIFLAEENYIQMQTTLLQQRDNIKEMEEKMAVLNSEIIKVSELFEDTKHELAETNHQLKETSKNLEETTETLTTTRKTLRHTRQDRDEQKHLVTKQVATETKLHSQANHLLATVGESTSDVSGLHSKLDRVRAVEDHNMSTQQKFAAMFTTSVDSMEEQLKQFTEKQLATTSSVNTQFGALVTKRSVEVDSLCGEMTALEDIMKLKLTECKTQQRTAMQHGQQWVERVEQTCNTCQNSEVERQESFIKEQFLAGMGEIKNQMEHHKLSMMELSTLFSTQLAAQRALLQQFTSVQRHLIAEHRGLVADFVKQEMESMNIHQTDLSNMVDAHRSLSQTLADGLVKAVNTMIAEQCALLSGKHALMTENLETRKRQTTEYNDKAMSQLEVLSEKSGEFESCLGSLAGDHNSIATEHITKVKTSLDETVCHQTMVEENVSKFTVTNQEQWKTHTQQLRELLNEQSTSLTSTQEALESAADVLASGCASRVGAITAQQTNEQAQLQTGIASQQTVLENQATAMSDWSGAMASNLRARDADVKQFIDDELHRVVPTGTTPQRRDFSYPNSLTKTKRHSLLLSEFRKDYVLNEAMNTPVPDDSFTSQISQPDFDETGDDTTTGGETDHNTSADSALSSCSMVSSNADERMKSVDIKENMRPPNSNSVMKARQNTSSQKQDTSIRPRSRTPTPKKEKSTDCDSA